MFFVFFVGAGFDRKDWEVGVLSCKGGRPNALGLESFEEVGQFLDCPFPFAQYSKMNHVYVSVLCLFTLPCLLPQAEPHLPGEATEFL